MGQHETFEVLHFPASGAGSVEDQQGRRNHKELMVWGLSVKDLLFLIRHPKAVTSGAVHFNRISCRRQRKTDFRGPRGAAKSEGSRNDPEEIMKP